ncbi:hydantoinase/oxoprolinase family protein [Rhodobacterales bacterium HTCC2150]|nr:hydantoinase/oxoprolinase family protein [Rhodobacterales bacterium HTCC2150] [Rhodobacteraceae bacterium HTCC2150]
MTILLGVDTGGTYTDAVLIRDETSVIASAKSLTTRQDLAVGIGAAVRNVLVQANVSAADISLASLSTTLATNALVEGQGGRVGLVYIGFDARDLDTHGLRDALKGDPVISLTGGHDHSGGEVAPLDLSALRTWLDAQTGISAFAVASQFATRNPTHEQAAASLIEDVTGCPVSASHHLSAKLNGPKRALTALLNARLIGLTHRLIGRAEDILTEIGVMAPLMVVRGDGALISSTMAKDRPIETILSGPAASIVGARWLTGADHALVSDIGGTTTDVAILRDGQPALDPAGARVGPYRTMVEAVAMRTTGLGGDSEVHFITEGLKGGITLGPRRLLPISLIAHEAPEVVLPALESQSKSTLPGEYDARFVRAVSGMDDGGLTDRERKVLDRIGTDVIPMARAVTSRIDTQTIERLVARGLVQMAGLTPSDASHVLGRLGVWNKDSAKMALLLFGRRRTGAGDVLSRDAHDLAQMIVDRLTYQTSIALLEAAFAEEETPFGPPPADLARHVLMQRGLAKHKGIVQISAGLAVDVIGLGASANSYYPAVGEFLHCKMNLPKHAGVANAIGAVVGRVTVRKSGTVTSPSEGRYRTHLDAGPEDFADADAAMAHVEKALQELAEAEALASGAVDINVNLSRDVKQAHIEARDVFVEATIFVEVSGRPRIAKSD